MLHDPSARIDEDIEEGNDIEIDIEETLLDIRGEYLEDLPPMVEE